MKKILFTLTALIATGLCATAQTSSDQVDIETAESINAPWYLAVAGLAVAAVLFWLVFLRSKSAKTETA